MWVSEVKVSTVRSYSSDWALLAELAERNLNQPEPQEACTCWLPLKVKLARSHLELFLSPVLYLCLSTDCFHVTNLFQMHTLQEWSKYGSHTHAHVRLIILSFWTRVSFFIPKFGWAEYHSESLLCYCISLCESTSLLGGLWPAVLNLNVLAGRLWGMMTLCFCKKEIWCRCISLGAHITG